LGAAPNLTINIRVITTDRDRAAKIKNTDEKPNAKILIASDHTLIANLSSSNLQFSSSLSHPDFKPEHHRANLLPGNDLNSEQYTLCLTQNWLTYQYNQPEKAEGAFYLKHQTKINLKSILRQSKYHSSGNCQQKTIDIFNLFI